VTKIPILRGIYTTTKQFTEGLTQSDKSAFRHVVLIEYPRKGIYSPGFLTGESPPESCRKSGEKLMNVFIPMVPNPMGGVSGLCSGKPDCFFGYERGRRHKIIYHRRCYQTGITRLTEMNQHGCWFFLFL